MSDELNQVIGQTIKELRKKRKKTQLEIRQAAGLSAGFFSDIENGKRGIGAVNLLSIADALGVSILRLIPKNWRDYCGA
jgi:transcriptional regulator with XRE-family HTH domain